MQNLIKFIVFKVYSFSTNNFNISDNKPEIDRNLKPVYDAIPSTAAFGALVCIS